MRLLVFILNILTSTPETSQLSVIMFLDHSSTASIVNQDQKKMSKKALFIHHFKILDSVVNSYPNDTVYGGGCFQSILFMVNNTKIEVTADNSGTIGRTKFNKSDWLRWHEWYRRKYERKNN